MNLYKWSTTAASNNSAVPDGAPENWLGQNVNDWARETMARVREQASDASYIDELYQLTSVGAKTLVRVSDTQFTAQNCDATSVFSTDRRIRIVGSTTQYGFVSSSSYSAPNTTVNVTMDNGIVPTSPTQALVHVDVKIRSGAYAKTGSGNGLNADKVDGYHVLDIFGPTLFADAIVNGSMTVWQRGTSGSCPAGARTYHADRWWTNPSGAAVTCSRTTTTPTGAISKYAKLITGSTSVTTCEIAGQRVESYLIPYMKTTLTFSALVKNDTGADMDLDILIGTPGAADDFTTVTNRYTNTIATISAGTSARVQEVVNVSGFTNIDNGLEIKFRTPSGSLDSGAKSVTITEIQADRSSQFSFFRFRSFPDEFMRCRRYYQKTFAYETAPAQNWASGGSGAPAGTIVIPGSADAATPNTGVTWQLPQPMRATPTVVTFNPFAADAKAHEISGAANKSVTPTVTASTSNVNIVVDTGAKGGGGGAKDMALVIGATAEAEL